MKTFYTHAVFCAILSIFIGVSCGSKTSIVSNGDLDDSQSENELAETISEEVEAAETETATEEEEGGQIETDGNVEEAEDTTEEAVEDESDLAESEDNGDETPIQCAEASVCPAGKGCVGGVCADCRQGDQCRAGEICRGGICGQCSKNEDCAGKICLSGLCSECKADKECQDGYGINYFCKDGVCANQTCLTDAECMITGAVCVQHNCMPCDNTYQCTGSPYYGAGYQCLNGRCASGNCAKDADCPAETPICGSDSVCRRCFRDAECASSSSYGTGYICADGDCLKGNCHDDGACAQGGKGYLCKDYNCSPCLESEDAVCASVYGSGYMCIGEACVKAECRSDGQCAAKGQICDKSTHQCSNCADDSVCSSAFGDKYYCKQGICVAGECGSTADCSGVRQGLVCVSHACINCGESVICPSGNVCDGGRCYAGECINDGECDGSGGKENTLLCEDHQCAECADQDDCARGGRLCDDKLAPHKCVTAECVSDGDCFNKTNLCDYSQYKCVNCDQNADCGNGRVCDAGVCKTGECASDEECDGTGGKLDSRFCYNLKCEKCLQNTDCSKNAPGVCDAEKCYYGNCVDNRDCRDTNLCDRAQHKCVSCSDSMKCGAGMVCVASVCIAGNCVKNENCDGKEGRPNTNLCIGNQCVVCISHGDCGGSAAQMVCEYDDGRCVAGTCVKDDDCRATTGLCDRASHSCVHCAATSDCGENRVCDNANCRPGNCVYDGECDGTNGKLNTQNCESNYCAYCVATSQCSGGFVCVNPGVDTGLCRQGDCVDNSSCNGGVCENLKCRNCKNDAECGTGYKCDEIVNSLGDGKCWLGTCTKSHEDDDCSPSHLCLLPDALPGGLANSCKASCSSDAECEEGWTSRSRVCDLGVCHNGTCTTTNQKTDCKIASATFTVCDPATHECAPCNASDKPCPSGNVCDSGVCFPGDCASNSDCGSGLCVNHLCVNCAEHVDCGSGRVCDAGVCYNGECASITDCKKKYSFCKKWQCGSNHICSSTGNETNAIACEDGDPTTQGEFCFYGTCVGVWESKTADLTSMGGNPTPYLNFSGDGKTLIYNTDTKVRLYDVATAKQVGYTAVSDLKQSAISYDGSYYILRVGEKKSQIYYRNGSLKFSRNDAGDTYYDVSFSPDNSYFVISGCLKKSLFDPVAGYAWVYNLSDNSLKKEFSKSELLTDIRARATSWSATSSYLFLAIDDEIYTADIISGSLTYWKMKFNQNIWQLKSSSDASLIAGTTKKSSSGNATLLNLDYYNNPDEIIISEYEDADLVSTFGMTPDATMFLTREGKLKNNEGVTVFQFGAATNTGYSTILAMSPTEPKVAFVIGTWLVIFTGKPGTAAK